MDFNTQDTSNADGLVGTVCFMLISIFFKLFEYSLPVIDTILVFFVHVAQFLAALIAIYIGYNTIKKNNRKRPI